MKKYLLMENGEIVCTTNGGALVEKLREAEAITGYLEIDNMLKKLKIKLWSDFLLDCTCGSSKDYVEIDEQLYAVDNKAENSYMLWVDNFGWFNRATGLQEYEGFGMPKKKIIALWKRQGNILKRFEL